MPSIMIQTIFGKVERIVSLDQWYQIKEGYGLKAALQYFPNDFRYGYPYVFNNIENQELKQEVINGTLII
jgi:hypothetical protein